MGAPLPFMTRNSAPSGHKTGGGGGGGGRRRARLHVAHKVLRAGLHLVVEKPFTKSLAEAVQIVDGPPDRSPPLVTALAAAATPRPTTRCHTVPPCGTRCGGCTWVTVTFVTVTVSRCHAYPALHLGHVCHNPTPAGTHVLAGCSCAEAVALGLKVMICQNDRFRSGADTLQAIVRGGTLGRPYFGLMTRFGHRSNVRHSGDDDHAYLWERGVSVAQPFGLVRFGQFSPVCCPNCWLSHALRYDRRYTTSTACCTCSTLGP